MPMNGSRLGAALTVTGLLVAGPLASTSQAQQNQPIYPAYDGFLKNADGSYTLSFAYFSHNADVVTIPPGTTNAFAPAPGDRQQPTVFKPGHWRFQCIMVVGPEFDGKMVWNLSYAGTTTGTSQRMLQSNWYLVEGAEELKKIDFATAKRGVCLNRAPIVRVLGVGRGEGAALSGAVGEQIALFGSIADEGLPRGKDLVASWKQVSGPGQAKFENSNVARTHATFPSAGEYILELTATDSELTSTARITAHIK
jgi:K319-like protein